MQRSFRAPMSTPLDPQRSRYVSGTLRDGTPVLIRDLEPGDAPAVARALTELSPASRYQRFLGFIDRLTGEQVRYLTHPDGVNHLAVGMALATAAGEEGRPIAIARCVRSRTHADRAEVAIAVADDWQNQGAGFLLLGHLHRLAWSVGIRHWEATLLAENEPVRRLLGHLGKQCACRFESPGVMEALYQLYPPA